MMATFPLFEEPHDLFLDLFYHNPFWNLLSQNQSLKKHPRPTLLLGWRKGHERAQSNEQARSLTTQPTSK